MNRIYISLVLLVLVGSCGISNDKGQKIVESRECNDLKRKIESEYAKDHIDSTIVLFHSYEACYSDRVMHKVLLGMLYKQNNQKETSDGLLDEAVAELGEDTQRSKTEVSLLKATVGVIKGDKEIVKQAIENVSTWRLSESQKAQFEFLKIYASQGEFISSGIKMELF